MKNLDEQWLPVVGYEGIYRVSSLGRVQNVKLKNRKPGYGTLTRKGYLQVALCDPISKKTVTIASIVCTAFHGPRPDGYHVDHKDAVKTNNAAYNLEWVTPAENVRRARAMGLQRISHGEEHTSSKLTEASVRAIRIQLADGALQKVIAKKYHISGTIISRINSGRVWKHVADKAVEHKLRICRNGHIMDEANTAIKRDGDRCRECKRLYVIKYRQSEHYKKMNLIWTHRHKARKNAGLVTPRKGTQQ